MEPLSVIALIVAVLVGIWQWRVVTELEGIREELYRLRMDPYGERNEGP